MGARACCAPLLRSKLVCKTNELWIYLPCTIVAQPGYLGWPTLYATWRKPLARFFSLVSSPFHHPDCNSQWPVLEPFATQKKVVQKATSPNAHLTLSMPSNGCMTNPSLYCLDPWSLSLGKWKQWLRLLEGSSIVAIVTIMEWAVQRTWKERIHKWEARCFH